MRIRTEKMAIYKIQHVDGKLYVGSAARLSTRWSFHRKTLEVGKHHSIHLQRAWDKYGRYQFTFEIIELIIDKSKLIEREQFWMDFYDASNPEKGYNICSVAGSPLGTKASKETREKLSIAHKGKKLNLTDEERKRRSEQTKELNFKRRGKPGTPCTEETKNKLRLANLGKIRGFEPQTIVYKQKIKEFAIDKGYRPSHTSKDLIEKELGSHLSNYVNKVHRSYDKKFAEEILLFPSWRVFYKQKLIRLMWNFLNLHGYKPYTRSNDSIEKKLGQDIGCFMNPEIEFYDEALAEKLRNLPTKNQYLKTHKEGTG